MATVTLNKTGREIMNAVKAGKPVMVHYLDNGFEEYDAPYSIYFDETRNVFGMAVSIDGADYTFNCDPDETPTSMPTSGDGGSAK